MAGFKTFFDKRSTSLLGDKGVIGCHGDGVVDTLRRHAPDRPGRGDMTYVRISGNGSVATLFSPYRHLFEKL